MRGGLRESSAAVPKEMMEARMSVVTVGHAEKMKLRMEGGDIHQEKTEAQLCFIYSNTHTEQGLRHLREVRHQCEIAGVGHRRWRDLGQAGVAGRLRYRATKSAGVCSE